jgi:hypothetical protein
MGVLSLEKLCELLGTTELPGNAKELEVLAVRMGELLELNGEAWVRANRALLIEQWRRVVELKTIR